MSLQDGKLIAIAAVKSAFERAAEMDGRSSDKITEDLSTDIINAVITLIMSGDVDLNISSPIPHQLQAAGVYPLVGTAQKAGKIS